MYHLTYFKPVRAEDREQRGDKAHVFGPVKRMRSYKREANQLCYPRQLFCHELLSPVSIICSWYPIVMFLALPFAPPQTCAFPLPVPRAFRSLGTSGTCLQSTHGSPMLDGRPPTVTYCIWILPEIQRCNQLCPGSSGSVRKTFRKLLR